MKTWRLILCKVVSYLYDIFCRSADSAGKGNPHFAVKEPPEPNHADLRPPNT
jgi:hypothetical protein